MKPVRILLLSIGVLVTALSVVVGLTFNSGVQTWAARKAMAAQPGLRGTLGAFSVGLERVELQSMRIEQNGAVLTLPSLMVDVPVIAAGFSQKITITKCIARGWTLDLSKASLPPVAAYPVPVALPGAGAPSFSLLSSAMAADPAAALPAAVQLFEGVFAQLQLPVDLALDGVDLEGEILLPSASAGGPVSRARLTLVGGGLSSGREARFKLDLTVSFAGEKLPVSQVAINAILTAAMDSPRTFARFTIEPTAIATGAQFPSGVKLSAIVKAARTSSGESYSVTLATPAQKLMAVHTELHAGNRRLEGTWSLDLRSSDLAPFTLGRALPTFTASGEGKFSSDTAFAQIQASGRLGATADQLAALKPELSAVGAIKLTAEFDLAQRGRATRIERLQAEIQGAHPVASVRSLQPFELNVRSGELNVADPSRELLAFTLHGVPLAWAQPFMPDVNLTGGDLRGEFAATANNGGLALRPRAPFSIDGLNLTQRDRLLVRDLDVSLDMGLDYAPAGWQADLSALTLRSAGVELFQLTAKAGQLAGNDQPLKATGRWSANLAALLVQPMAAGSVGLTRGSARGDFVASVAGKTEVELNLELADLTADPKLTVERLPDITARVRADISADGKITLNVPLFFQRTDRKSDLTLAGTLGSTANGLLIDARVNSAVLHLNDLQLLAAPFASEATSTTSAPSVPKSTSQQDEKPVWAGFNGTVALALKKVIFADKFELADVGGTLRVEAGALKFEGVRAGLGAESEVKLNGGISFLERAAEPYTLAARLDVTNFDPAPVLRALNPDQLPILEGKFTIGSELAGQGRTIPELGARAHGDFNLSSKGGLFRALSSDVAAKMESTSKTASAVAFLGNVASAVSGRKEYGEAANKAEAVASLSKMISVIHYDQLNVVVSRDADLNTVLKDFTLIAPELRLAGTGKITAKAKTELLAQPLAMQFQLGARGHTSDLLKALGALDATKKDDLGYFASTLPLKITGTLGQPNTSELQTMLVKLAYEKSSAGDLLNKFLGGR